MTDFVQYNTRHLRRDLKDRMTALSALRREVRAANWSAEAVLNEALELGLGVLENHKDGSGVQSWIYVADVRTARQGPAMVEDWSKVRGDEE